MSKELNIDSAIDLLKSGGSLDRMIISDMATSKVKMMDALLLAENGFVVPDGNIVYDDEQIQYDPDFDSMKWGQAVPFRKLKETLEVGKQPTETTELVVNLPVISAEMKQWLAKNKEQINLVVNGLLESMYKAERLSKP